MTKVELWTLICELVKTAAETEVKKATKAANVDDMRAQIAPVFEAVEECESWLEYHKRNEDGKTETGATNN